MSGREMQLPFGQQLRPSAQPQSGSLQSKPSLPSSSRLLSQSVSAFTDSRDCHADPGPTCRSQSGSAHSAASSPSSSTPFSQSSLGGPLSVGTTASSSAPESIVPRSATSFASAIASSLAPL